MNALAELRKRAGTPATLATSATLGRFVVSESQESQGVTVEPRFSKQAGRAATRNNLDRLKTERARLLVLAAAEWIKPAHVHRLPDDDVLLCLHLDDGQRVTFLRQLADTATRHAGRAPDGDTAPAHCHHCGPVWLHPDMAAALPRVGGWPRALGCPWCFVRKAGGYIPRPAVNCGDCLHATPDTINPEAGMGGCTHGKGEHYPMARHVCTDHFPRNPHDQA